MTKITLTHNRYFHFYFFLSIFCHIRSILVHGFHLSPTVAFTISHPKQISSSISRHKKRNKNGTTHNPFISNTIVPIPLKQDQLSSSSTGDIESSTSKNGDKKTEDLMTKDLNNSASSISSSSQQFRRKMELSWCNRDNGCLVGSIRETVTEPNNHISFQGPATGQVTYNWIQPIDSSSKSSSSSSTLNNSKLKKDDKKIKNPSVLLLVKRDDDHLMKLAAEVVNSLTAGMELKNEDATLNNEVNDFFGKIDVLLFPECAAKLKYKYGVDNDQHIHLFESQPIHGYGDICSKEDIISETDTADIIDSNPDLICTLGGDGLLMYASSLFPGPVPLILCIAGGSLGFLTPFSSDEMVDAILHALGFLVLEKDSENKTINGSDNKNTDVRNIVNGGTGDKKYSFSQFGICVSMRMRLDCCIVNREGIVRVRHNVLNEVVIDRGSSSFLTNLECYCDNVHLTTVQADGIIFSTPTGSTAYSMAAGGSVVHPAVPAILVTPICPHVLSFRSMVFPDHVVLRCYVPDDARSGACVAFDGKNRRELSKGDSVQIKMSAYPVPTINRMDHSADWLDSLKRIFQFNVRPVQKPF